MDQEPTDQGKIDNMATWSGSDSSQEAAEPVELRPESCSTDDAIEDFPLDSQPAHILISDSEACKESWETESEQQSMAELSGSEEDECCGAQADGLYLRRSNESIIESNHNLKSFSPHLAPESPTTPPSLSSSFGSSPTKALTLAPGEKDPRGASNKQDTQTGVVSSEGGSSDAPPACVSFGISKEGAEPAQRWDSWSNTDLCRPDRRRARYTRLSQSERHVKETKTKCKRIALLLTDAPNPHNKGALLFKKRRQRVKNYTFVSYGTGENFDSEDQIEEEELTGCSFEATSDSELAEEYSVCRQQCQYSLNWKSLQKMEGLPETQGKGALMFAQRRKRMDEIVSEHEELRSKGLPVEGVIEAEHTVVPNIYDTNETYMYSDQDNYADAKQQVDYHEDTTNVPKPLVPNRTAKPFLGFQVSAPPLVRHSVVKTVTPVKKKPEPKFKVTVPVPCSTSLHVWSPTGDIIASRDERISVPAIKTAAIPESKRKGTNKQPAPEQPVAGQLQNKGERRSFIECEEDCFSLGAEACNFMQPKSIKLKNPPPVAPKPTINPACPPWMLKGPMEDPYVPPRSQIAQPFPSAVGLHIQHYSQPQQMSNHWAPDQTAAPLQTSSIMSSQLHPQPATNSWSLQQSRSTAFGRSRSVSLPRQLRAVSSPGLFSPVSAPGTHATAVPRRQTSFPEKPCKPPTPWEAASRSPIGSVDEAFMFPGAASSIVSSVKAAGHRKSLPEPPEEWKRRVSLDPAPVIGGYYQVAPAFQAPSMSRTFLPEKTAFHGPLFRPAQQLRASTGYIGQGNFPTQYFANLVNRNQYC